MNILDFQNKKNTNAKIVMVTCYDFWSAQIINQTAIDIVLVGDSAGMVMHGHDNTLPMSVETMTLHTMAVAKALSKKIIVTDLPFLSYRKGLEASVTAVETLMKAGAHAIKLEGAVGNLGLIQHLVESGVPVMGHLGLTPQFFHQLGGFKLQGDNQKAEKALLKDAKDLEQSGCFGLVLECIPSALAKTITQTLKIPTIGIGAGPHTDGQVLVLQDLLGFNQEFTPKFLKTYLDGAALMKNALNQFAEEVRVGKFPGVEHSYSSLA